MLFSLRLNTPFPTTVNKAENFEQIGVHKNNEKYMGQYDKVIALVRKTKKIILNPLLRNNFHEKGVNDYVTAVDKEVSSFLKSGLKKLYKDIAFVSEEEDIKDLQNNRWILDPIDGTVNLMFDYRLSSVSLGLMLDNKIVFGIVYNPFTSETFTAEKGKGAFLNGKQKLTVSQHPISKSLIEFGLGSTRKDEADESFNLAKEIFKDCIDIRRIASSALSICYIAARRIDGFLDKSLKPWDYAAASLILEEAGGIITDFSGHSIQFDFPTSIIASNGKNHNHLLGKVK